MSLTIRATTRLRNDAMICARERKGWSQGDLASLVGCSISLIAQLEALHYTHRDAPEMAREISFVLNLPIGAVIPEELVGQSLPSTMVHVRTVSSERLLAAVERQTKRLTDGGDPVEALETEERDLALHEALGGLGSTEREVIELRYGLGGGRPYTLGEVGHRLSISPARVGQVEGRAIRKLQRIYLQGGTGTPAESQRLRAELRRRRKGGR